MGKITLFSKLKELTSLFLFLYPTFQPTESISNGFKYVQLLVTSNFGPRMYPPRIKVGEMISNHEFLFLRYLVSEIYIFMSDQNWDGIPSMLITNYPNCEKSIIIMLLLGALHNFFWTHKNVDYMLLKTVNALTF